MKAARRPPEAFEAAFAAQEDPWGFASSSYEQAKYDATLDALGPGRVRRALELGCAIGVLTARLAERCDELVALDGSPTAVARARTRVGGRADVRLGLIPEDLPAGPWDLVVASEVLYYLGPELLEATLDRLEDGLRPGGRLLAVHWTGRAASHPLHADEVHAALRARSALRPVHGRVDPSGYRLDLLQRA